MSLNKILHTHLTAGAQKNMLKVWNFTKNKLYHVWFENNLRKISEQIFLRMLPDRYALNSCFNCPLMLRHSPDLICTWREIIKKMRSLLTVRNISLFEFYDMCYIHLQSYTRRNTIWFWLSVSDSSNSFENENEKHSAIPTASGTEILFLIGGRPKFGRPIRYNLKFSLKSELVSW